MSELLKKTSLLWTYTKNGENLHVLVDGRLVLMTRSQAQRYRELRCGEPGSSPLVTKPISNDKI